MAPRAAQLCARHLDKSGTCELWHVPDACFQAATAACGRSLMLNRMPLVSI